MRSADAPFPNAYAVEDLLGLNVGTTYVYIRELSIYIQGI